MTIFCYFIFVIIIVILNSVAGMGKPMILACDTYATPSTCARPSTDEVTDCETCCGRLLERMFDCPPCRYFVLNNRRQGSSCFCTVCFKQYRHRRRHNSKQMSTFDQPI